MLLTVPFFAATLLPTDETAEVAALNESMSRAVSSSISAATQSALWNVSSMTMSITRQKTTGMTSIIRIRTKLPTLMTPFKAHQLKIIEVRALY